MDSESAHDARSADHWRRQQPASRDTEGDDVKMETLTWVKRKLVCLYRKPFMVALESNGATCLAESENPCHFDLFSMNSDFSFLAKPFSTKPFSSCKFCAVKVYVQ